MRGLVLVATVADGALMGEAKVPAQGVPALALVELAGDLAPVGLVGEVAGGVDGPA